MQCIVSTELLRVKKQNATACPHGLRCVMVQSYCGRLNQ